MVLIVPGQFENRALTQARIKIRGGLTHYELGSACVHVCASMKHDSTESMHSRRSHALISTESHKNLTVPSFRPIPSAALSSTSISSSWNKGQEGVSTFPGLLLRKKILSSVSV
jgi:hypothetical protein